MQGSSTPIDTALLDALDESMEEANQGQSSDEAGDGLAPGDKGKGRAP